MSKLLFYILDYAAILPAAVMCMLPVLKSGRLRTRVLLPLVTAAAAVSSVILGLIRDGLDLDADIPLLIFLIPAAEFYFLAFDIKKNKLWFIFISTIAIFSFGGLSTHFVEAFVDPQIEMLVELAAKWGISLLFLTAEMIFIWRLRWLIENDNINAVWRFIWAVPAIVTAANYYMIPQDTANVRVGRFPLPSLRVRFPLPICSAVLPPPPPTAGTLPWPIAVSGIARTCNCLMPTLKPILRFTTP